MPASPARASRRLRLADARLHRSRKADEDDDAVSARIGGDIDKDAFEMRFGPNHRPEMLDHINLVELRECRLGNILQRFTGGVR